MAIKIRIDDQAFNRGVDDALSLNPVRTAVSGVMNALSADRNINTGEPTKSKGVSVVGKRYKSARNKRWTD